MSIKGIAFNYKRLLVAICCFCYSFGAVAQECDVKVLSGSSPQFIFNSITKYNNGVTLDAWTRLKLEVDAPTHTGWELYVKSNSTNITIDEGSSSLPLETFELAVNVESENQSLYGGVLSVSSPVLLAYDGGNGTKILSGDYTGDGTNKLEVIVSVSYECGTKGANMLLGEVPGIYFVDLVFTLTTVP